MLPSIAAGQFGVATKPVYGPNSVHEIGIVKETDAKGEEVSRNCPSLPLISEGSFTSLVSRRSGNSLEKEQRRGNRVDEEIVSRGDINSRSTGLKMKQLQLDLELKNVDRGWYPQGLNPRLANPSRSSQLPTMGLHMMSTSQRFLLQQSLAQPVESLHNRRNQMLLPTRRLTPEGQPSSWQLINMNTGEKSHVSTAASKKGYLMTLGGQTQLNTRYRMPAVGSGLVSSGKDESASVSSYVHVPTPSQPQKAAASKPEGVAIHSRCCCRHHKQDNEQRATLKSRSSESLRKERMHKERKLETSNNEKRVKLTDRPPPKKQPKSNVTGNLQSRRKSKRANVLASDSNTSLQEQRKQIKKSAPKMPEQKCPKSPVTVKDIASVEPVPMADSPPKENLEELMIYIESFSEIPHTQDEKEVIDKMDVDYSDESELKEQSNRVDVISVLSLQTVTASDPQRSATPRLLKVSSEQQTDLSSLSQVFRKLDTDCDGHISFNELKKSLPSYLTRQQINYLKKIYDMACESTYFGLEEFTATHQMCELLAKSSPMVSNTFSTLDPSSMDFWLSTFMESFSKEDKKQSGVIDMQSFQNLLFSIINVHPNSFIVEKILHNLGKSKDDTISGVELLAYIPYLVAVAPKDT